jgi:hypothetical protein
MSTLADLSVNLTSYFGGIYIMVEIIPPVLTEYLRHFYDEFEFNSCLVEMVEVSEIFIG